MAKILRERKPVDYARSGVIEGTGTPGWLKIRKADENGERHDHSPELGLKQQALEPGRKRTKSAPLQLFDANTSQREEKGRRTSEADAGKGLGADDQAKKRKNSVKPAAETSHAEPEQKRARRAAAASRAAAQEEAPAAGLHKGAKQESALLAKDAKVDSSDKAKGRMATGAKGDTADGGHAEDAAAAPKRSKVKAAAGQPQLAEAPELRLRAGSRMAASSKPAAAAGPSKGARSSSDGNSKGAAAAESSQACPKSQSEPPLPTASKVMKKTADSSSKPACDAPAMERPAPAASLNLVAAAQQPAARPVKGKLREAAAGPAAKDLATVDGTQPGADLVKQLLEPGAVANPKSFTQLQDQYTQLQGLYQQLKSQKIQDLELLLNEQDEYCDSLSASVQKLADHWRAEAEKQAELGRKANSAEFIAKAEMLEVENAALKQRKVELEEQTVQLRKELAERDARAAASHAHVNEVRIQTAAQLEEARVALASAITVQDQLRLELEQARSAAVPAGQPQLQSPADSALPGMRNMSLQCPTPPLPSPGIGFQFPTPAAHQLLQPSPGVAVQCTSSMLQAGDELPAAAQPSPALAGRSPGQSPMLQPLLLPLSSLASEKKARQQQQTSLEAAAPLRTASLGLGLPAASAMMKRRSALDIRPVLARPVVGNQAHLVSQDAAKPAAGLGGGVEEQLHPGLEAGRLEKVAAMGSLGSPVDGLCEEECNVAQAVTGMASNMVAPEALDPAAAEQEHSLSHAAAPYGFVDLDPTSAVKSRAAGILPGRLDRLMSAAKAVSVLQRGEASDNEQLSAGMAQLVASAAAAAGALSQQTAARCLNAVSSMRQAAAASVAAGSGLEEDGLEDSANELSNQLSTNLAQGPSNPLQLLMAVGVTPARQPVASGSMTGDNQALMGPQDQDQEVSKSAPTPGMTPRTARLVGGVVSFFGFKVLPLPRNEGYYEYIHPQSGLRFQLGPLQIEDSELAMEEGGEAWGEEGDQEEQGGREHETSVMVLHYKPVALGKTKLPHHLQGELMVPFDSKNVFVNDMWKAVNIA